MTIAFGRRDAVRLLAGSAVLGAGSGAWAQGADSAIIGWPSDVPSWDPNQRFAPDEVPLYKMVFDQPLEQEPGLSIIANLMTKWAVAPDGLSFQFELRDDALFSNGDRLTAEDVRYTFFERNKAGLKLDIGNTWHNVTDIEVLSPTRGVFRFSAPMPTVPQWLAFLGSFVVPKKYLESVGPEGFRSKPVGSGPYRLAEYELNARIVFERNERYWGPKPKLARITVDIIKDPTARAAAVEAGRVDLTTNIAVREVERLGRNPALAAEIYPISRIILLQVRSDLAFADANVRLAAHHAIDKAALSKAFYGGAAVPLSVVATKGTPGDVEGYTFAYDPAQAAALLAKSGFSTSNPVRLKMATTNGHFPSDFDIARAIVQMWHKVGIEAELETIEYAKYFELNRGRKLPEATLYSWDNATGDPEIYSGYLLNPKMPFSSWSGEEIGNKLAPLLSEAVYEKRIAGYKAFNREAAEAGAAIPLLQSVQTLVRKQSLGYRRYGNGWVLGNTMGWS